jgi:hypothetical protein
MKRSTILWISLAALAGVALSACGEIDQHARTQKIYAEKKDEKLHDGKSFGGDQARWELALKERGNTQNEYLRTETSK